MSVKMMSKDDDSLFDDDQSLFEGDDENDLALQSSQGSARIAREDIRLMNVVRAIVMLILLTFAVISGETVFIISLISEENNFSEAYNDAAKVLTNTMYERLSAKIWIAKSFANDLTIDAENGDSMWPYVSYDHFSDRCKGPLHLSDSSSITFAPFVGTVERQAWEDFAATTYSLIDNENNYPDLDDSENEKASTDLDNGVSYHSSRRALSQGIYRFVDGAAQNEANSPGGYFPIWQQAPSIESDGQSLTGTMFNLLSYEARASGLRSVLQLRGSSISEFLFEDSSGQDYASYSSVRSALYAPMLQRHNTSDGLRTVGVLEFEFQWEHVFSNVLKGIALPMVLVLENTCDSRKFSYQVRGDEAIFLGEGDLHDDSVDGFEKSNSSVADFESLLLEHAYMPEAEANLCAYKVTFFPSSSFKKHYVDNKPEAYRGIVIGVFLFIVGIFWCYDTLIERRQGRVIDAAAKSDAIVRSLFPSNIRDQLYEQAQTHKKPDGKEAWKNPAATGPERGVIETPKNMLRSFIRSPDEPANNGEKDTRHSAPIADLYPHTTVLFADISGFTAWSSEREPSQVFTLLESIYRQMDRAAKKLGVFKVETVGDCYVAATGIPDPQPNYGAEIMVRFARTCVIRMNILTKDLESQLGPGTAELSLRVGIHSGPVTAGVLRGQKARFQLFGDTMNTASRMESTGQRNKIQLSADTAEILIKAGHSDWVSRRSDLVQVKGKGSMQTYWLQMKTNSQSHASSGDSSDVTFSVDAGVKSKKNKKKPSALNNKKEEIWTGTGLDGVLGVVEVDEDLQRLVDWNVNVLLLLLKRVVTARVIGGVENKKLSNDAEKQFSSSNLVLDDVQLVINMPDFDAEVASRVYNEDVDLVPEVKKELHAFVTAIASGYRKNSFHNFEHASHVILSANKLLKRIMAADDCKPLDDALTCQELHNHTYGIGTDPLTQFAVVFSALIHDVGHEGVPNFVLGKKHPLLAEKYSHKSIAEQRSVDIAWELMLQPQFSHLRASIYQTKSDCTRFRYLVVNGVMATDIFDKELKELRDSRWETAFSAREPESAYVKGAMDRKATIVIEHIIQASDVAHTMQHFFIYSKWNERLFKEMYFGFLRGELEKDPSTGWYKGELWFFDNYVIPLAKKLKDCAVFGVSSDEYLNYAMENRKEWERKGEALCEIMKSKAEKEAKALGLIDKGEAGISDNDSVDHSLGSTSIDTSVGISMNSDLVEEVPHEIESSVEARIADEVRMALEDSALPAPRDREVPTDISVSLSTRSVKAPPGKLGVTIDTSDDGPIVQNVSVTSPLKGRMYPGDRIVGVNGVDTDGLSKEDLAILMASQTDKDREFTVESA